ACDNYSLTAIVSVTGVTQPSVTMEERASNSSIDQGGGKRRSRHRSAIAPISQYQTPSDGTKQRILYFGPVLVPSSYSGRYQTIASPTGFAVLIIASGGTGYQSPSMGTQY